MYILCCFLFYIPNYPVEEKYFLLLLLMKSVVHEKLLLLKFWLDNETANTWIEHILSHYYM